MNHPEDALQACLFQWITLATPRIPQLALAFAVPNGGRRNLIEAKRLKGQGVRAGVPDILIACRGADPSYIGFALELKSATGTLRPEQKVWRDRLIGAGWYWVLSRDFDHARGEIARYFNAKP